jgi:hypothetical protein
MPNPHHLKNKNYATNPNAVSQQKEQSEGMVKKAKELKLLLMS